MTKWKFKPELLERFRKTGYELIRLHAPDARDQRGRSVGKAPHKGWRQSDALSVDEAVEAMESGHNVGVRLREGDLVIDVDPRNFLDGDDPVARLRDDLGLDLTDYPTVRTGSGGLHIYMRMPESESLRDTLEAYQGIEFKAHGRQLVSPGSVHPDTKEPYVWEDDPLCATDDLTDVPPAPSKLVELARRPGRTAAVDAGKHTAEELGEMLEGLDPEQFQAHDAWLEMMMASHHATAGEGRDEFLEWSTSDSKYSHDAWLIGRRWDSLHADQSGRRVTEKTLYKRLFEAGEGNRIPRPTAADDFADDFVPGDPGDEHDPGLADADLQEMVDSLPEGDAGQGPLEALNARGYAAVNDNGSFRVYRRKTDYSWPDELGGPRPYWEVQRKGDFLDILSNVRIQKTSGDRVSTVSLASEWLKWGRRTSYDGVAFDPAHRIPKEAHVLNLWTDWAVEPKRGDWSLLRQLLEEGLCDGDEASIEYVLDWSAFMVQNPDRQAEVALVMKGQKGTGKGTYFRALAQLAGQHGMHISDQQHFTNHFNAHLRDCIFLFVDEALWAGDKRAEGELKRLITEPTMLFEAKGKDAVPGRNMLHIGMASNEDFVVPASMEDERRFAVFEVNPKFRGDRAFFDALYTQLGDGGLQALLFDLKTRDVSDFHPRAGIPQTKALATQKLHGLDAWDSWWYESLCVGDATGEEDPLRGTWDVDPLEDGDGKCVIAVDDAKDSIEAHLRKVGDRHYGRRSMDTMMGQRLARRVPGIRKVRLKCPETRPDLKSSKDGRVYGYELPSLAACRAAFEAQIGAFLPWDGITIGEDDVTVDLDATVQDVD